MEFNCPVCRSVSRRLFQTCGYWIRQCDACGHQFAELEHADGHVSRVYGDEYFTGGGAGYTDYFGEEQLLVARGRWYARRIGKFCRPGTVLEIGAAAGFTLAGFREAGWITQGIEPNATMASHARQRLDLDVEQGTFETWQPVRTFDLVLMLQVLPHFVDPADAIMKAARLVRPGGHLLIETWDRESWTARLSGSRWHEYSPPSVLHWFSRAGVARLAKAAEFGPVATGRPSKWINAAHAKSVLRNKAEASLFNRAALTLASLIPERVCVPYLGDDLFWALFRRV
jgi:SAM-dependent methyltransferase